MDQDLPKLQKYALLLQLGHTSSYQVYLARPDDNPQLVTVRQARRALEADEGESMRQLLEALALAPHPHLPHITEVGHDEELLFWVADYAEADTLDMVQRVARAPAQTTIALRVCLDVASALLRLNEEQSAGPILSEDVSIGTDGAVQLIPPLSWNTAARSELTGLANLLGHDDSESALVVYLIALLWDMTTGVSLVSCRDGNGFPRLSSLVPGVSPPLDNLVASILSAKKDGNSPRTLPLLVTALGKTATEIAPRSRVRDWLLEHVQQRLNARARVLRSKYPPKPSKEIPQVKFPTDLTAIRLANDAHLERQDLERQTEPVPGLPTALTPQPFVPEDEAELENHVTPQETLVGFAENAKFDLESDADSRVPSSGPSPRLGSSPTGSVPRASNPQRPARAPLESALAEYAERVNKDRKSNH